MWKKLGFNSEKRTNFPDKEKCFMIPAHKSYIDPISFKPGKQTRIKSVTISGDKPKRRHTPPQAARLQSLAVISSSCLKNQQANTE